MRKSGKTIRLNPVDDDHVTDHPARAGMEAIMDQKLFAQCIRSERASAYWFAASLWGVTGLVLGAILGGFNDVPGDELLAAAGVRSGVTRHGGRASTPTR